MKYQLSILLGLVLLTASCGQNKTNEELTVEMTPEESVLVRAAKYSTCADWLSYRQNGGTEGVEQSIKDQSIAIFNGFKVTYKGESGRYLNWWNIRIVFEDSYVKGGKFTCNFLDDWDGLTSALTGASWDTETNIYKTATDCKVICKGLEVEDKYKNQSIVLNGVFKVTAYSFANEEDTKPVLVTGSVPVQVRYDGEP